jgi:hypothetical protein
MMILLHASIAVISLVLLSYNILTLSRKVMITGYISVVATIVSGLYLAWIQPAHMLHVCIAGLLYLTAAALAIIATKVRIVRQRNNQVI